MKRFLKTAIATLLILILAVGCAGPDSGQNSTPEEETQVPGLPEAAVEVAVLKGPTAIGMVNLMKRSDAGESALKYNFKIAGAADEITADLIKGNIQIAAIPANLASVLYNKTSGGIKVMAINNLSVLYIVELGNEINSLQDLKGKTIYSTGKGTTPEYTLNHLLSMAGLEPGKDVAIEYKSEATEVAAVMSAAGEDNVIAMLPQPYVTVVTTQNEKARIALNVGEEWDKLHNGESTVVTGVVVVNAGFAGQYPDAVNKFLEEYEASATLATTDVDATAALVGSYDLFKEAVAKKAIPLCNIVCIKGSKMREYLDAYLKVLFDQNPDSVGGALPKEDFCYIG